MKKYGKFVLILAIILVVYILLLVFLLLCERINPQGSIKTLFDAFWYSLVTFSTVGYGDYYPTSMLGKIVGILFIILSVVFLGAVIGRITSTFQNSFQKRRLGHMGTGFKNHVIIIGWDSFSSDVATQLIKADKKVAVITQNKDEIDIIYQNFSPKEMFACFSDIKNYEALKLVNASRAKSVFLNNGGDSDKLISIINIRKLYPNIEFVVILDNAELKETFVSAGVTYVLSKNEIASKMLASYIFEPAVADFTSDLISSTDSEEEYDIQQYKVCEDNPYINSRYGEMFFELKNKHNIISIGLNKISDKKRGLIKAPDDNEIIEKGDDVIVIANGASEKIMQKIFKVSEGI